MNMLAQQSRDKITRNVAKDAGGVEYSPMNPPDAYAPPKVEQVPYEEYHPAIRQLLDEHQPIGKAVAAFEEAIIAIEKDGVTRAADASLRNFFQFFDDTIGPHAQKEDRGLFPLVHQRLLETEEHGAPPEKTTAIDMMEDEHVKIVQSSAVTFNMFGLAARLPDERSRAVTLDVALNQAKTLIEMLRLHVFREEQIVFPLAHKLVSREALDALM